MYHIIPLSNIKYREVHTIFRKGTLVGGNWNGYNS